jgi:Carbohydrate-selective porin, OprB family/S-layer homology domain
MHKNFWQLLLVSPVISATMLGASIAIADEPVTVDDKTMAQVTSVSQLSDVQPTDWAFQALQSLVERYGCIAGYPDGTYRGNRALTRYEFAAGLNACLDRVNELIATATNDLARKEDLATIQKLQEEFSTELATLRGRVDSVEVATAELEANQFSTTTKLNGEVVAAVAGIFTGDNVDGNNLDTSAVLVDRTRLEFVTSFTGEDELLTRLSTGNFAGYSSVTGTAEGELGFAQDEGNAVGLEVLEYSFPLGKNTQVFLAGTGGAADDFTDTVNILDGDGGSGALSSFGTRNPIYYLADGAGLGLRHQFGNKLELSLGYLAGNANDPTDSNGLFNGPYSGVAQLTIKPTEKLSLGLTYINSYNADDTGTGSGRTSFAQFDNTFFEDLGLPTVDVPTSSNSYGVELSWKLSDRIVLGGWAGYTNTQLLSTAGGLFDRGDINVWNYAITLAFPDLGKEGNLLGFVVGMEPKVTDSSVSSTNPDVNANLEADKDNSLHIEGFYQFQVTENIAVTPGVIWITAPGFDQDNNDIVIGALRTTFTF